MSSICTAMIVHGRPSVESVEPAGTSMHASSFSNKRGAAAAEVFGAASELTASVEEAASPVSGTAASNTSAMISLSSTG